MIFVERELNKKIMATDIFIAVSSKIQSREIINRDIDNCILMFHEFESKYSRFKTDNELFVLNNSPEYIASPELFSMLELGQNYFKETRGIFDLAIKNALETEGYSTSFLDKKAASSQNMGVSKNTKHDHPLPTQSFTKYTFDQVGLNKTNLQVIKPLDLQIDLGGIGKGFIVDKVSAFLKQKYSDFCVNAGGDIYARGQDHNKGYNYWAIDIENPQTNSSTSDMPLLMLTNSAVATSGVNTRKWLQNGQEKNHVIDPRTGKSLANELMCVTVIGENTTYCDVFAKYLLILGLEKGTEYCQNSSVPAVFITKDGKVYISQKADSYVWKEKL